MIGRDQGSNCFQQRMLVGIGLAMWEFSFRYLVLRREVFFFIFVVFGFTLFNWIFLVLQQLLYIRIGVGFQFRSGIGRVLDEQLLQKFFLQVRQWCLVSLFLKDVVYLLQFCFKFKINREVGIIYVCLVEKVNKIRGRFQEYFGMVGF